MTGRDPKSIIDQGIMGIGQWLAVFVTVGLNALDGFDVLSISFASPGIAKEWGIDKAALGWVLSMELLGMAVGSIILGGGADTIGRRPMIFVCLITMSLGMWGAAHSTEISVLLAFRLITGLGIGGMLAAINAAAAEYSNQRWRGLAMSLMVIGYPLGGIFGGLIVGKLLVAGNWRDIFVFGAWASAASIPIVWVFAPESVAFLARRRRPCTLKRVNDALERFGHEPVIALINDPVYPARRSIIDIFNPVLLLTTIIITFAYFAHIITFYFVLKWVPKIVVDMGFSPAAAAGVLTWANVGGATGGVIFGAISARIGLRNLTIIVLVAASAAVAWFGRGASTLSDLALLIAIAGFITNSAVVGIYSLIAKVFPTHVRATGTGFAIGIGRGGAALAPVIAGYLFRAGFTLQTVALFMAAGSLLSAGALLFLKVPNADR